MIIVPNTTTHDQDRSEAFRTYAKQRAAGAVFTPPHLLPDEERRLYIRQTLREDHQYRIKNQPEGAENKFDEIAADIFSFFRGTALLYYRDYAGIDAEMPAVLVVGDIHPENFGVMPNEDGAPFFGVNDFDEAYIAPFTYDIRRGGLGFYTISKLNGYKTKKCKKVVKAFVEGYIEGLKEFAKDDREKWLEYRLDNSPKMIRKLIKSARESRRSFLKDLINLERERFVSTDEIIPHSKYIPQFQEAVNTYITDNEIPWAEQKENFFEVKDVAIKKGSGTASLGLPRYFVLIEGRTDEPNDNIILEFKQTRRSALYGLVPHEEQEQEEDGRAARIVTSHSIHLVGGDPFYGRVEMDGHSYLVRERSPFKDDIDVDDLSAKKMRRYANICGRVLAQTHARSDEDTGIMEGNAEEKILSSIVPNVFQDDMIRFAQSAYKQLKKDYKLFKKDHQLGAYNFYSSI